MPLGLGTRVLAFTLAASAALAVASSSASAAPVITPPGGGPPIVPGHPMTPHGQLGNDTVTSSNWSGYAVESASPFNDVKGSWVQPAVTCPSHSAQYSSFWAGLDGYSSNSVEQLGTDSDCAGRNRPSYYAWYEMYPAYSVSLSPSQYPVQPGDTLSAEVSVSGTSFTLSLKSSAGWTFTTTQSGSGLSQSSAELIAESPEICNPGCKLAPLADFGTVNFTGATAAVNGGKDQPFSSFTYNGGPHEIIAVTNNGTVKAQPSALFASGTSFSITWNHS